MKIEHIAIWANDLELLREFYVKTFNLTCSNKYVNSLKGFSSYFLTFPQGGVRIELMHNLNGYSASNGHGYKGLAHFAISVGSREAVNNLTNQLRVSGCIIAGEPRTTGDGYYESAVLDPEGNYIEITE